MSPFPHDFRWGTATAALAGSISRACTLNEPNVVSTMGWVMGMFPPGKNDPRRPP